ncbi:MAG: ankyrin repeat domain-containing protein [Elainellaceae cyanobacterium]
MEAEDFLEAESFLETESFLEALYEGNTSIVEGYLQEGFDPNTPFNSQPLLHQLITWPNHIQPEMLDLLIQYGVDVNAQNTQGESLLHRLADQYQAFSEEWTNTIGQQLIDSGADVNVRDRQGRSVLQATLCNEHPSHDFVNRLLDSGANLEALDTKAICSTTLLHLAARVNHPGLAEYALKQGIQANTIDTTGQTPLHYLRGKVVGDILLAHGADLEARNSAEQTPLATAVCLHGGYEDRLKRETIAWLLNKGAQGQVLPLEMKCNGRSTTLLAEAIGSDSVELAQVAIANGSAITTQDNNGETPLHNSARFNAPAVAALLLNHGAQVNIADSQGYTPLHRAAIHRNLEVAQLLIERGAPVNAVDLEGHTPLYEAKNDFWDENLEDMNPSQTQAIINVLLQAGGEV